MFFENSSIVPLRRSIAQNVQTDYREDLRKIKQVKHIKSTQVYITNGSINQKNFFLLHLTPLLMLASAYLTTGQKIHLCNNIFFE